MIYSHKVECVEIKYKFDEKGIRERGMVLPCRQILTTHSLSLPLPPPPPLYPPYPSYPPYPPDSQFKHIEYIMRMSQTNIIDTNFIQL